MYVSPLVQPGQHFFQAKKNMPKKKKKNIQVRQQRRQERRKAAIKKRKQTGLGSGGSREKPFSGFQAPGRVGLDKDQFLLKMLDSSDMIQAPEFDEVIISPVQSLDILVHTSKELGLNLDDPENMAVENRAELQASILEKTTRQLLDEEVRTEIIDALKALQRRLQKTGDCEGMVRATLVASCLKVDDAADAWCMIGLVQALVRRSAAIGYDLLNTSPEAFVSNSAEIQAAYMQMNRADVDQKASALMKKYPGLQGYLNKQTDRMWDECLHALIRGDLYLDLFTSEELLGCGTVIKNVFGFECLEQTALAETPLEEASQEQVTAFAEQLGAYITDILTPERLDLLRARLDETLKDPAYRKWWGFLAMIAGLMQKDHAVENEKAFLLRAFMGELEVRGKADLEKAKGQSTDGKPAMPGD